MFVINTRIPLKMSITSQNPVSVFVVFILFISYFLASISHAKNTITQGESIKDGETIVSQNGEFSMGFFSPENPEHRYVGIWYSNKTPALLWVANRETPISDKTGVLTIGIDGNLLVLDGNNNSIWSSNVSSSSNNNTAMLENTGNLYLSSTQDASDVNKAYWQSFNNPTDTFLPGMRVRVNAALGENRAFTSWTSASDPSSGKYSLGIDPRGSPQIVMWEGLRRRWRSGPWNAVIFTGVPNMTNNYLYGFKLSSKEADGSLYFTYNPSNTFDVLRFLITWDGKEEQQIWDEKKNEWIVMQSQPANDCELYNKCGDFGVCSVKKSHLCSCMKGFVPNDLDQWNKGNWSGGCVRRTPLKCGTNGSLVEEIGGGDGFREVKCAKLPDFVDSVTVDGAGDCRDKCLRNCSCNAYASVTGIGCMMWSMNLADVQEFEKGGQTFYIRLASSELGGKKKISNFLIAVIVVTGTIFLCLCIWLLWRFRFRVKKKACSVSCRTNNDLPLFDRSKSLDFSTDISLTDDLGGERKQVAGPDLPLFNFSIVALATNNFDEENKLGQGGFGPVYKGKLPGGQDIAVKRLSRRSNQGLEEFKNEMILIAKLQHRNLVRLLGCCIEGEEKMLLYEYMPNKSLDYFLFDTTRQSLLDWTKRFEIIEGIARGLLYLHRDSRLRIIHRDLKASNILLDEEMNPKISDFGLARIFGGNQNEANTNRVVGTYGYMSPEYAMEGLFSVKSDVYSFGVLLLEVLSGLRNNGFRSSEHSNLIGYAWHLWTEGKAVELIDPSIADSCPQDEALKCIHVGMLCVQDSAANRPTMSSVVLMLESETATLPLPRQPTYTSMRSSIDTDTFTDQGQDIVSSSNDMTVTVVVGR